MIRNFQRRRCYWKSPTFSARMDGSEKSSQWLESSKNPPAPTLRPLLWRKCDDHEDALESIFSLNIWWIPSFDGITKKKQWNFRNYSAKGEF